MDDIAAACGINTCKDLAGVLYRITGETGAELLFCATQEAIRQLADSERRHPPLTWACAGCGAAGDRPRPGRATGTCRARPRPGLRPAGPGPGRRGPAAPRAGREDRVLA